ncbi:TPA: flagellar type III secretion system protein FlhB [Morganella morganii]|uniref:Flagellar biosynthetic protein FlhB n=1 Tax=Morganella morganii TaxID=582 RepID=A0AAN5S1D0_MORMO|nr:flagellar type III secretion system protein FlhB [Morganella morganii]HAT3810671.1 flagellar type III secretion system protein FlhB [Morganella morganii]HBH7054202.1 flagellar type III secretion system protein FlhB [Morganella morganii]HEI9846509.1 flagellar type III secretion system protein FlhB [Morganella morganii]
MAEESDVEKTEDPTPHKREKARKEGQIPRSKELTSVMMLLVGWALMFSSGSYLVRGLSQLLSEGLRFDISAAIETNRMFYQMDNLFGMAMKAVLPFMLGLYITGIASPLLLGGLNLSAKSIKVDLKRISPVAGFKRLLSKQVLSELLKGVLKVALVGCAGALFFYLNKSYFIQLVNQSVVGALSDAMMLILYALLTVILFLIPVAGYDVFYQIMSNLKKLRMSRQEIRDEFKQQEGDPQVKGRIRQLQRAAARGRMMADVPDADVIVNNPTHYSVALSYKENGMSAPVVLAKGAGEVALRIRELGKEHGIPSLEAPPLARALYRHCEPGEQIPVTLYSAVAEVLAWVYGIRRWRNSGGIKPKSPDNLPVPRDMDFQTRE